MGYIGDKKVIGTILFEGGSGESAPLDSTLTKAGYAADAKAVGDKFNTKVDKEDGKYLLTTEEKNKLAGIEAGANKTKVDTYLSSSSTNPVQNKAVKEGFDKKQDKLVSGSNIKTINGQPILGEGDILLESGFIDTELSETSNNAIANSVVAKELNERVTKTEVLIECDFFNALYE